MSVNTMHDDHIAAMNSITAIIEILGSSDTLGISEQVAELKAQRDALAAENAGLIKFITQECHVAHIEPETFYGEEITRYVSADGYQPETPATDSLLAEARAQVWMEAKDLAKSAIASDSIDHIDFLFDDKAAQLRKGVQS